MTPSDVLPLAVVLTGTGAGAAIDVRTGRVPNRLTASVAALGLGLAVAGLGRVDLWAALAGGAVGLLLMLPGHLFGGTGAGDVKLVAAAGTLLGPVATAWAFLFTLIAGGAIALLIAVSRALDALGPPNEPTRTGAQTTQSGTGERNNRFAYAPAIAVGAILAAVLI